VSQAFHAEISRYQHQSMRAYLRWQISLGHHVGQ